jgi:hypothetical protein
MRRRCISGGLGNSGAGGADRGRAKKIVQKNFWAHESAGGIGGFPSSGLPHYSVYVPTVWKSGSLARRALLAMVCAVPLHGPLYGQRPQSSLPAAGSLISQPIYPLSAVHKGLHGTAYTVFEGSTPEPMDVEILGVLHNAIGPGKDMILARLVGAKPEYTGVVAGMSGSPVYIDGKLLGAIGFRIGQFTKEPIAGITPIQQMLDVISQSSTNQNISEDAASSPSGAQPQVAEPDTAWTADASSLHQETSLPQNAGDQPTNPAASASDALLQPIETPLVFDGFSQASIDLFRQRYHSLGFTPVSGLGSASPDAVDPAPVVAGSAISAIIVSGDLNMAATCTVTYVDPKRLLACGHPITQFGNIALPMTKAEVMATVASQLDPIKIINTTQTVGAFTEDRESGILGRFGEHAPMIPVTLTIRGIPHPHVYHFSVAEHPRLTTGAMTVSVFQAMQSTNGYNDPSSYRLHGVIEIAGHSPVTMEDLIAPDASRPSSLLTALTVAQRFDSIFGNPRQIPDIRSVNLTLDAAPGRESATLIEAHTVEPVVHPGDPLTVEATLRPYRQAPRLVRMTVRLPRSLPAGPVRLLLSDGATLDHTLHLIPNPAAQPLDLDTTILRLNQLHDSDRLYVTLLAPVAQATVEGRDLPAVPLSMASVLQPDQNDGSFTLDGETAVALGSKPLDLALSGSQVLTIDVKP